MKTGNQHPEANNVRKNPDASKSGGKRPENKDDLDSRKNKEYPRKKDIPKNKEDEPDFEP